MKKLLLALTLSATAFASDSSKSPIIFGSPSGTPCAYNIISKACLSSGGSPGNPNLSLQYNVSGTFTGASLLTPDSGFSFYNTALTLGTLANSFSYTDFNSAGWLPAFGSLLTGQTDPNGGTTAAKSIFSNRQIDGPYQVATFSGSQQITMSLWMKGNAGGEIVYLGSINNTSSFNNASIDVFSSPITVTNAWVRYSFTFTPTAACQALGVFQKASSDQVFLFGPQYNTLSYASGYVPQASGSGSGVGIATPNGVFTNLSVSNPISPFLLDPIAGATSGTARRLYYDTADNYLAYLDNSGTSHQVATVDGGGHSIAAIGTVNISSGTATITDAAITSSSVIVLMITSANQPGVYQVSPGSGSASIQSYNTGFAGTNGSDNSTLSYAVIN